MTPTLNIESLRTCLVDTYKTDLPTVFRDVKDNGPESTVVPALQNLNRNSRAAAETLLTDLGLQSYWSRVAKAIILPVPIKQRGTPHTEAAEFIVQALQDSGFSASTLTI